MPCIKVGISEWILVKGQQKPIVLWTDGFIGCVGVAIRSDWRAPTNHRAFMTHIDSCVSVEEWEKKIEAEFKAAIGKFGSFDKARCVIVVNRDEDHPKTDLEEAVEKTLSEVGLRVELARVAGMRLWCDPGSIHKPGFNFEPMMNNGFLDNGFRPEWGELMNSVTGREYIEAHELFSVQGAKAAQI
jgi:hypothetical protein